MKKSDYDFSDLVVEYKDYIYEDNGDLTVFGCFVFILFGVSLVFAIKRLQRSKKK